MCMLEWGQEIIDVRYGCVCECIIIKIEDRMSKRLFDEMQHGEVVSAIEMKEDMDHVSFFSGQHIYNPDSLSAPIHINVKFEQMGQPPMEAVQAKKDPLTEWTTGYDLKREMYSQKEMLEAFKVIDINHDDFITYEDLSFFLDYINEPHTPEQVREMIHLVKPDASKLNREDFFRIGQGSIIPLAGFKMPEPNAALKQQLLNNLTLTFPHHSPQQVLHAVNTSRISLDHFEEERNRENQKKVVKKAEVPQKVTRGIQSILELQTEEDILIRRREYESFGSVNLKEILEEYEEYADLMSHKEIATLLKISEKEAKKLYPNKGVHPKRVAAEAIAYSSLKSLNKIKFLFGIMTQKEVITVDEILHAIGLMKGKDQAEKRKVKMNTILKNIKRDVKDPIEKEEAIELLAQFSYDFGL